MPSTRGHMTSICAYCANQNQAARRRVLPLTPINVNFWMTKSKPSEPEMPSATPCTTDTLLPPASHRCRSQTRQQPRRCLLLAAWSPVHRWAAPTCSRTRKFSATAAAGRVLLLAMPAAAKLCRYLERKTARRRGACGGGMRQQVVEPSAPPDKYMPAECVFAHPTSPFFSAARLAGRICLATSWVHADVPLRVPAPAPAGAGCSLPPCPGAPPLFAPTSKPD